MDVQIIHGVAPAIQATSSTRARARSDMRGTATFLKRLWTDQSGATPAEAAIVIAIIGVAIAGLMIKVSGMHPGP